MNSRRLSIRRLLALAILVSIGASYPRTAWADDVVYGNYTGGYGHGVFAGWNLAKNSSFPNNSQSDVAHGFVVPPDIAYRLDRIELTALLEEGDNVLEMTLVEDNGSETPSGTVLESFDLSGRLELGVEKLLVCNSVSQPTLMPDERYWIVLSIASANSVWIKWPINNAGVGGCIGRRPNNPPGSWISGCMDWPNNTQSVFRIVGTPITPPAIKPSYTIYELADPLPNPNAMTRVYPEVFCPPNDAQFNMCVTVGIGSNFLSFPTSALICGAIRDAINNFPSPGDFCANCPTPHGFQAICSGNVLRVTNSTAGPCSGAYLCADRADPPLESSMKTEVFGIEGTMFVRLIGNATGQAESPGGDNIFSVVHATRTGPSFVPVTYVATSVLTPGMTPAQVVNAVGSSLISQGDAFVVIQGDKLRFSNNCPIDKTAAPVACNYDLFVNLNDTGLRASVAPIDDLFGLIDSQAPIPVPLPPWTILALSAGFIGAASVIFKRFG